MLNKNVVLAVDDEPFNLEIMEELLADDFDFHAAENGPACLESVGSLKPEVILLDVSMPDMDGYQVCRKLKENPSTSEIPVMFVSARGALDERIEGYNVGGDDYIVKPFAREELLAKLNGLMKFSKTRTDLETQVQSATQTAFTAMADSSAMGSVMQFIQDCYDINDYGALAKAIMSACGQFGLATTVQIRTQGKELNYASSGECTPMAIELMSLLRNQGRLYEFSPRMQVNYPQMSLLIKNMPVDDVEMHGRLRDYLCLMVSSADARVCSIETEGLLKKEQEDLTTVVADMHVKLRELVGLMEHSHKASESVLRDLVRELESKIPHMGLEEDQEDFIIKSVDKAIDQSLSNKDVIEDIKIAFGQVIDDMDKLRL